MAPEFSSRGFFAAERPRRRQEVAQRRRPGEARNSEVSSAMATVRARARKKTPVTPVMEMSGRKTTMGVMVEPTSGLPISRMALRMASERLWPRRGA